MKRNCIILFVTFTFAFLSCSAPAFLIKSLDDKFSDPDQPFGTVGQNNRLSTKSSQGGSHIDEKGVYIDPYVFKDRQTKKIKSLGFYINHFNFDVASGFNPINEIIFITDNNSRVVLTVEHTDMDYDIGTWNNISNTYNTSFSESGIAIVTPEDVKTLINAKWIEAKIVGGELSQTYDKGDISKDFLKNLRQFYSVALK